MEYINSEEFLKQPNKVQDAFKTWLEDNLNVHDWVKLIEEDTVLWVDSVMDTRKDNINVGRVFYLGKCVCWSSIHDPNVVPLLTEGQLRKFIEEKTESKISTNIGDEGYQITLFKFTEGNKEEYNNTEFYREFNELGNDLLQAYWQVVCKIA
ncbi:hypothetical protein [Clostridium magnum]|uniref:hypothetical protein n=1 Tax=Clostridium magnum TaxID=33954 RepID=UPI000915C306|nr:hypothetical protein [Clostridium magnum]SHJ14104.1 hypothetical protein SAMN02745944_05432 [Clostridium magnum DSM 2767]